MKNENVVIWKDVDVPVIKKSYCVSYKSYKKRNDRAGIKFHHDCGDIPVAVFNAETGQPEAVVNPRGRAYASRNQRRYKASKRARKEATCHE